MLNHNPSLAETFLEGHLESITFHNPQNHYTIARLKTSPAQNMVTIVGTMVDASPGQSLKLKGKWQTHPKYGQQFKIIFCEIKLPATVEGIKKYLESGFIKGIGPLMATKIVNHFGTDTFEAIEKFPEKLLQVKGIGNAKAAIISDAWREHHVARSLMQFLQNMGVSTSYSGRILQKYGDAAIDIIKTNPYRLQSEIYGIGFYFSDAIAMKLGTAADDPARVMACVIHMMEKFLNQGHNFIYKDQLILNCNRTFYIDPDTIKIAVDTLADSGELVIEKVNEEGFSNQAVYKKDLYQAETGIAKKLEAILSVPVTAPDIDAERISFQVQKKTGITLSAGQLDVLHKILLHKAVIITGGPGTGKTTLIRSIHAVFSAMGKKVLLAAPTGRAARRLTEVSGRNARTIHRLLGYNYDEDSFDKNRDNPLEADTVIIDEASMVDTMLMYHLIMAVPVTAAIVIVGDVFQLPSVGPGNILSDLIRSSALAVFYLKKIFRQAHESSIVTNAHRVRQGKAPVLPSADDPENLADFYFLQQSDPDRVVSTIVELCSKSIPERFHLDPVHDIQVLTPMHKGVAGTTNLNQILQKVLNPNPVMVQSSPGFLKQGDKVMHLKNNYQKEVFNGDIGIINLINSQKRFLEVDYYQRIVKYDFSEIHEISPAYAISVHKSQGSEYPAVIVPILTQHYVLLQRNLLYTAITRAKKLVVLIGTKKALNIALKNNKPKKRLSGLAPRIFS